MDELTAYRILRIEPGSTRGEIKEAYAALSKEFHPEEHPEEFQEVHEAFLTLTRKGRRRQNRSEQPKRTERTKSEAPVSETVFDFEAVSETEEKKKEPEYDFNAALSQAENAENERIHRLTLQALERMRTLLLPEHREKSKLFIAFFEEETYREVLGKPEFLSGLAGLLADSKLKNRIYNHMISYYRFRGAEREQLIPEAAALYDVLEGKCRVYGKRQGGVLAGVAAGTVVAAQQLRPLIRMGIEGKLNIAWIFFLLITVFLFISAYRLLYVNHSSVFSQFILASVLLAGDLMALVFNGYTPLFGNQAIADVFGVLVLVGALIWISVLGGMAVIRKLKNKKTANP